MDEEDKVLDIAIDDLFKDPEEDVSTDNSQPTDTSKKEPSELTKAMSNRINEVKAKTERETKDNIAKELGFENYADLQKSNERQVLKDAGLDDKDIEPIIQKLVDKRLAEDPRIKRLEELEARDKQVFVKEQLKEINKLVASTGVHFKSVDELPGEVLKMWEKTGNLKQAYLAVQGESLITKQTGNKNGDLSHLANPGAVGTGTNVRPLTQSEKDIWRMVNPDITDEELNKKTMPVT